MALAVARLVQFLEDFLGQDLAQLNTPLVEAVDVPDGALGEGEVLVIDDKSAELSRANGAANKDRSGWAVAEEALVRDQLIRGALSTQLVVRLSDHQGLSLCKVVGGQHLLVHVIRDGVVRLGSQDEVGGN